MKASEAKTKVCPYLSTGFLADTTDFRDGNLFKVNCICDECIFWVTTVNGKKEIDRKTEPYDMTPIEIGRWSKRMKNDGYENIGREDGFRDVYVKYKEADEGFCQKI